ncbi:HAAS signaling domain-containing protein [Streptomyces californicus]|uniref:HAAS signaling domain-containing protein n=1 Tax=Streptomyces californicus TaxID=67351 RepID=UPI00380F6BED
MKTTADPVRDYLAAVEREASALPAGRRQELVADLAEHIEVTRAEQPATPVGDILAGLGDPRTIAATALAEVGVQGAAPAPARRGKVHPLVPLLMLTVPYLLVILLPDVYALRVGSGIFRIVGGVLLCTSVHWRPRQKVIGVTAIGLLPVIAAVLWNETTIAPAGELPALVGNLISLTVIAVGSVWLWRSRRA